MKNKDLGTVESLIFLIKHLFSSIFHYLLSFDPIFGNGIFLILGKKTPFALLFNTACSYHLRLCISSKNPVMYL